MGEMRQSSSMGLIIREKEPANLETPFDQVDCGEFGLMETWNAEVAVVHWPGAHCCAALGVRRQNEC
jgi:hypothetical protein